MSKQANGDNILYTSSSPYPYSVILIYLNKISMFRQYDAKSRLGELKFCVCAYLLDDLGSVYFFVGNQVIQQLQPSSSLTLFLISSIHF